MKLTTSDKVWEPCPEFAGQAICVDVTPLTPRMTKFGEKHQIRLVFQTSLQKGTSGDYWHVWSQWLTPSFHDKASLSKILASWFGREFSASEKENFDTEELINKTCEIIVKQTQKDGKTYSSIVYLGPDKTGKKLTATGKYVRAKDRPDKGVQKSSYAPTTAGTALPNWASVKVHVTNLKGSDLGDLPKEKIIGLLEKWVPSTAAQPKLSADDKRLLAALNDWEMEQHEKEKANVPEFVEEQDDLVI